MLCQNCFPSFFHILLQSIPLCYLVPNAGLNLFLCCFPSRRRDSRKEAVDHSSVPPVQTSLPPSKTSHSSSPIATEILTPVVKSPVLQESRYTPVAISTSSPAPPILSTMAAALTSPLPSPLLAHRKRPSGFFGGDNVSNNGVAQSVTSRRVSSRKFKTVETSVVSNLVYSLEQRSGDELGSNASSKLLTHTYDSLVEWIRIQRMSLLPPEGSGYDKVLSWAQLFIERLHSFNQAIEEFAGDSYLATRLAFGYCALLLELGQENVSALMISFSFFYSTSRKLGNLLETLELFGISQEIREQLVLALADLVTLVAKVSMHFHKVVRRLTTASISIDLYKTFPGQIQAFRDRCEKITESMWRYQLLREHLDADKLSDSKAIRFWLAPEDHVLGSVFEQNPHLAHDRDELTCLWMAPHLARFLKSPLKSLAIAGKPGSGRTVLASVIVDQLQHPIGGVSYSTIFVPINARVPAETTPRAVVKSILYQLFDKCIGNVQLLQILSAAHERSRKTLTEQDYDQILWSTLESALSITFLGTKELVIVVDGVDETSCGEATLLQLLSTAAAKAPNAKVLTFGAQKPLITADQTFLQITEDSIFDDIAIVVRSQLQASHGFIAMSEWNQESVVGQITEASQGSFLWAKLAAKQVRHEHTEEDLLRAVDTLIESNPSLADFTFEILQSSNVSEDAKHMLLWLFTADRPLHLRELEILASIQIDDLTVAERKIEALHILKPLKSLVCIQDGYVFLRHGLIRASLLDVFSKGKLVSVQDQHADLATRLLIYIKNTVLQENEPSLVSLDWHDTNILLKKHPLLEFAIRYWVSHVQRTTAFITEGSVAVAQAFARVLPKSITALRLAYTLWETIPTPSLLSYMTTVTTIYRQALSENHVVTLQSIVFQALLNQRVECFSDAITLFYEATIISRTVLSTHHIVTMQMAKTFDELTVEGRIERTTEIMVQRESILLLLVECYQSHYGKDSETVIAVLKQLIEHYRWTKEEKRVEEIIVMIASISEHYLKDSVSGDLGVELKRRWGRKSPRITLGFYLDNEEADELIQEYESYDIEAWIRQADAYIAEGKVELAQRTYIEIWQRVSKEYRTHYSAYWEQRKMTIVLAYSKFLISQTREYEASSVLASLWQEYEQANISMSETSISYFQEVARLMKVVGISEVALSVLKRCSRYYESISSTHTSTYKEIQETIQTTSKEIVQSFSSSSTTISETKLEEFFYESSGSIETFEETSFTVINSLITQYIEQHRWQDATRAVKKVIRIVWPSLFAPSVQDVTLPEQFVDNCVELAERLIFCYSRRRLHKEEDIRIRLYRAVRAERKVDDKLREQVTIKLLEFFESTAQTDLVINLQQELLVDYIDFYGGEHGLVIKTLWILAELTHPRPISLEYYRQIIQVLNKNSTICHPEAVEPMTIIATELWIEGRYQDALAHYKILFTTFLSQPDGAPEFQTHKFVQELYERYIRCLRIVHADFALLHRVTVEYHALCKRIFGSTVSITIQATLTLARLCQESKRFGLQAIALYEELLVIESEEIDLNQISETLDALYDEQAVIVTSTKESTSSTQVERAVKAMRKRITTTRETHGWAHEESLIRMKEIITFYTERNETETVTEELTQATVNILSSETSSTQLISAASTIASSYIAAGQTQTAIDLSHEIYRQIVMKDTTNVETFQFNLTSKESQSLTFLAHMEYHLRRDSSVTVTEILAALMTEYVYFEEFRSVITAETSTIHTVSISAARLYQFLKANNRPTAADRVFDDFMNYFLITEGQRVKVTESAQVEILLITILNHLSTHQSHDFVRTIGIAGNHGVIQLLKDQQYDAACDLAEATFRYLAADESYRLPTIVKFAFVLGMSISGRNLTTRPNDAIRKQLLEVSAIIILDALKVMNEIKIDISQIGLIHLNALIGLLGERKDYKNLAELLTQLWNSREAQRSWKPSVILAMGRRLVLARYLVGEYKSALRLAEDIVYNCRRVHGAFHPATLDASVLLSQLYTSVGRKHLLERNQSLLANRHFKKSVAVHEDILRIFANPMLGEIEYGLENSMSTDDSGYDLEMRESMLAQENGNGGFHNPIPVGEHVRRHLYLLKLATERLGNWPKEYDEYRRLNVDLFREFESDLQGVEGVEHWDVKAFGAGRAEADVDLVDDEFEDWEILE